MRRLPRFYTKLSGIFLVLIVMLGFAIAVLSVRAFQAYEREVDQKLHHNLARDLAVEFEPLLRREIDYDAIRSKIRYMMEINPRIDIYLLDGDGLIKASFLGIDRDIVAPVVDLDPIIRFLVDEPLPILGTDPLKDNERRPFSAAAVEIMGEPGCYLYIIIGSHEQTSMAGMLRNSYITRTSLAALGLVVLVAGVVGLILFALLTGRIGAMRTAVSEFERGNFAKRIHIKSTDEIGELASTFNSMADKIEANLDDLKQTDRLRRELIANVSHDLRSPIASIQGYLETLSLKNGELSADEARTFTDIALKNSRRLASLVEELFDLSKLDAEQISPELEAFSLPELLQDLALQFLPRAEQKGIALNVIRTEGLPPVMGDIGLIERAVSNLVDNALRYTPEGGSVSILPDDREGTIRISVSDSGTGIAEEDLPHVFERFYRADKSRGRDLGGSGLGLAIAARIVALHGSELEVDSELGRGTTFFFDLPCGAWTLESVSESE